MGNWLIALALACCAYVAHAGQVEAENTVTGILFEENMESVTYAVRANGFVDILFGVSVSDADHSRVMTRLKAHPDIPGVLAG